MDNSESRRNFSYFLQQRHKQARQAALEASRRRRLLKGLGPVFHKYGISRVYAFGSLLTKACRRDSDLDLYVEDLQPEQYWDMKHELALLKADIQEELSKLQRVFDEFRPFQAKLDCWGNLEMVAC